MSSHKSTAVYLLVALVAFCFISAPAYGDHPWDIDWDGDGDDNVDPSTGQLYTSGDVTYDKGEISPPSTLSTPTSDRGTWFTNAFGGILSGFVFDWLYDHVGTSQGWFEKAELNNRQHDVCYQAGKRR